MDKAADMTAEQAAAALPMIRRALEEGTSGPIDALRALLSLRGALARKHAPECAALLEDILRREAVPAGMQVRMRLWLCARLGGHEAQMQFRFARALTGRGDYAADSAFALFWADEIMAESGIVRAVDLIPWLERILDAPQYGETVLLVHAAVAQFYLVCDLPREGLPMLDGISDVEPEALLRMEPRTLQFLRLYMEILSCLCRCREGHDVRRILTHMQRLLLWHRRKRKRGYRRETTRRMLELYASNVVRFYPRCRSVGELHEEVERVARAYPGGEELTVALCESERRAFRAQDGSRANHWLLRERIAPTWEECAENPDDLLLRNSYFHALGECGESVSLRFIDDRRDETGMSGIGAYALGRLAFCRAQDDFTIAMNHGFYTDWPDGRKGEPLYIGDRRPGMLTSFVALRNEYPDDEHVALACARAFQSFLSFPGGWEGRRVIKETAKLYDRFPEDEDIALLYAKCLTLRIREYGSGRAAWKKIYELALRHELEVAEEFASLFTGARLFRFAPPDMEVGVVEFFEIGSTAHPHSLPLIQALAAIRLSMMDTPYDTHRQKCWEHLAFLIQQYPRCEDMPAIEKRAREILEKYSGGKG